MVPNFEQIIASIQQLPAAEREKVMHWIENQRRPRRINGDWQGRVSRFRLAQQWISENRLEFLGRWVCLDGNNLISAGINAKEVYAEAKSKGIAVPFIEQVRSEEASPFWGGWD